ESDVVFSAAKLFFAYGLGNAMSFTMAAGATAVLMAERPAPQAGFRRLAEHRPTIFYGGPTLYAAMLANPQLPPKEAHPPRLGVSAGEARPAEISTRWRERMGTDLINTIGSTEMLHVFMGCRPGDVRHGTTGVAVPGYELRLVDEAG